MKDFSNIILPCAGSGTRLGLPYPKPLLSLDYHKSIIDYSFELLSRCNYPLRVIVVINKDTLQVVDYLKKYKEQYNIIFKYQSDNYPEFIGAIKSMDDLFLETNIVLLPDTVVETIDKNQDIIGETIQHLKKEDLLFWVKPEVNTKILAREGAVATFKQEGILRVTKYTDKPKIFDPTLTGYWAAFGFNKRSADYVLRTMKTAIEKKRTIDFCKEQDSIKAIEVKESFDLGVWSAVYEYLESQNSNKKTFYQLEEKYR